MRRPTLALLTYSVLGGSLMALTAGALAQAASTPSQPTGSHEAVLALVGPGASGVIGALVVAVYNKVSAFISEFDSWKTRLETEHKALKSLIENRPCMLDETCDYQEADDVPRRRKGDQPRGRA